MSDISFKISSDSSQARKDLSDLGKSVSNIETRAASASDAVASIAKSITIGFAGLAGAMGITRISSNLSDIENKLKGITSTTLDLARANAELKKISISSMSSMRSSVDIFATLSRSIDTATSASVDLVKMTETVQKAVKLSGSSIESSNAALIQLSQGLQSGTLRGEELNSVLEQTPELARTIAAGLNQNIAGLRAMAAAGELTANKVTEALANQAQAVDDKFRRITPSMSAASAQLADAGSIYVGEMIAGTRIMEKIAAYTSKIAQNLLMASESIRFDSYLFTQKFVDNVLNVIDILSRLPKLGVGISAIFDAVATQIGRTLPFMQLMVLNFNRLASILGLSIFLDIKLIFASWYADLSRVLIPLKESLGLFMLFGDTRIARAFRDMFDARSLDSLNAKMVEFAKLLKDTGTIISTRPLGVWFRDVLRPVNQAIFSTKIFLVQLGLLNNQVLFLGNIRLDRLAWGFEVIRDTIDSVWKTVLRVPFKSIANDIMVGLYTVGQYIGAFIQIVARVLKSLPDIVSSVSKSIAEAAVVISEYFKLLMNAAVEMRPIISKHLAAAANAFSEFAGNVKPILVGVMESIGNFFKQKFDLQFNFGAFGASLGKLATVVKEQVEIIKEYLHVFYEYAVALFKLMAIKINAIFKEMVDGIETNSSYLDRALNKIKKFTKSAGDLFYDLMDAVVGHSYYPDMVKGILDWSDKLYHDGISKINKFTDKAKSLFKDLSSSTELFNGKTSGVIGKMEMAIKPVFPNIDLSSFQSAFKLALFGVFATTIAMLGLLMASQFLPNLGMLLSRTILATIAAGINSFGKSQLDYYAYYDLGRTVGYFIFNGIKRAITEDLPNLLSNMISFAKGIGATMADQLGIFGKAIKGILDVGSMGNGDLLFGAGASALAYTLYTSLGSMKAIKDSASSVSTIFNKTKADGITKAVEETKTLGAEASKFSAIVSGTDFRFLAAGVLALTTAIFSDTNKIGAAIVSVPLLLTAFVGPDVAGAALRGAVSMVLIKTIAMTQSIINNQKFQDFFARIFGVNTATRVTSVFNSVADAAKGGVSKTYDALNRITDEENRKSYVKGEKNFKEFLSGRSKAVNQIRVTPEVDPSFVGPIHPMDNSHMLFNDPTGPMDKMKSVVSSKIEVIKEKFRSMKKDAAIDPDTIKKMTEPLDEVKNKAEETTANLNKKPGIFSSALFGKLGKMAGITAIIALFSSNASAAMDALSSGTVMDKTTAFADLATTILIAAGAIIPLISAFNTWRGASKIAEVATGTAKYLGGVASWTWKIVRGFITLADYILTAGSTLIGWASTAISFLLRMSGHIIEITAAAWRFIKPFIFTGRIFTVIATAASWLLTGLVAIFTSTVGMIAAAIGLLVGIGVAIFGEGDTFGEKVQNAWDALKSFFGWYDSKVSKSQKEIGKLMTDGISDPTSAGLNQVAGKVNVVDFSNVDEGRLDKIKELAENVNKIVKDNEKITRAGDDLTEAQLSKQRDAVLALEKALDKAAANSKKNAGLDNLFTEINSVPGAFETIWAKIKSSFAVAFEFIGVLISTPFLALFETIKPITSALTSMFEDMSKAMKTVSDEISSSVNSFFEIFTRAGKAMSKLKDNIFGTDNPRQEQADLVGKNTQRMLDNKQFMNADDVKELNDSAQKYANSINKVKKAKAGLLFATNSRELTKANEEEKKALEEYQRTSDRVFAAAEKRRKASEVNKEIDAHITAMSKQGVTVDPATFNYSNADEKDLSSRFNFKNRFDALGARIANTQTQIDLAPTTEIKAKLKLDKENLKAEYADLQKEASASLYSFTENTFKNIGLNVDMLQVMGLTKSKFDPLLDSAIKISDLMREMKAKQLNSDLEGVKALMDEIKKRMPGLQLTLRDMKPPGAQVAESAQAAGLSMDAGLAARLNPNMQKRFLDANDKLKKSQDQLADTQNQDPRIIGSQGQKARLEKEIANTTASIAYSWNKATEGMQLKDLYETLSYHIGKSGASISPEQLLGMPVGMQSKVTDLVSQARMARQEIANMVTGTDGAPSKDTLAKASKKADALQVLYNEIEFMTQLAGKSTADRFNEAFGSNLLTPADFNKLEPKIQENLKKNMEALERAKYDRSKLMSNKTSIDDPKLVILDQMINQIQANIDTMASPRELRKKVEIMSSKFNLTIDTDLVLNSAQYRKDMEGVFDYISKAEIEFARKANPSLQDWLKLLKAREGAALAMSRATNGELPALKEKLKVSADISDYSLMDNGFMRLILGTLRELNGEYNQYRDAIRKANDGIQLTSDELALIDRFQFKSKMIPVAIDYKNKMDSTKTFGGISSIMGVTEKEISGMGFDKAQKAAQNRVEIESIRERLKLTAADTEEAVRMRDLLQQRLDLDEAITLQVERQRELYSALSGASKNLITDLMKGKGKEGLKTFANSTTEAIINNVGSQLNDFLFKDLLSSFSTMFGLGDEPIGTIGNPSHVIIDNLPKMNDVASGDQTTSTTNISQLMGNVAGAAGGKVNGIFKLFKLAKSIFGLFGGGSSPLITDSFLDFAVGGSVVGPGTGTSDSILARLSNGEFVVNASSAKEHRALLESLNNGDLPKFADGGVVGSISSNSANIGAQASAQRGGGNSNQSVINIEITGDISRQTKKEIYGMLPTIAAGVNNHNREKGYRG